MRMRYPGTGGTVAAYDRGLALGHALRRFRDEFGVHDETIRDESDD